MIMEKFSKDAIYNIIQKGKYAFDHKNARYIDFESGYYVFYSGGRHIAIDADFVNNYAVNSGHIIIQVN
jgi:acetylornithine/succinyldiaminopimelate/putrescine aminotransferase